jgi:hypothetical protein
LIISIKRTFPDDLQSSPSSERGGEMQDIFEIGDFGRSSRRQASRGFAAEPCDLQFSDRTLFGSSSPVRGNIRSKVSVRCSLFEEAFSKCRGIGD